MDTRLKDVKYSMGAKVLAIILAGLCFVGTVMSGMFFIYYGDSVSNKSYFETDACISEFERQVYNIIELNVKKESNKEKQSISEEKTEEEQEPEGKTEEELESERLYSIRSSLSNTVNFGYYIKNNKTGETITNITASEPVALIQKQTVSAYFSGLKSKYNYQNYKHNYRMYDGGIEEKMVDTPYEVYAAVIEPLKQGDAFYNEYMEFSHAKKLASYAFIVFIISAVLMIICGLYLIYVSGRREKDGEIKLTYIDKIYSDVQTVFVLFAAYLSIMAVAGTLRLESVETWVFFAIVLSVDAFIGISYVLSMTRQIKNGSLIKNTLIYSVYSKAVSLFKMCFSGKLFKASIIAFLLAYGFINGILYAIAFNENDEVFIICALIIIGFNAAAVYFSAKALLSLSHIIGAVKEISVGNLENALDGNKISAVFSGFAENIKSIQSGLKRAVNEAIKGERMKTELITNVSHDLKTPLTSIINYVDLLKKEDLDNERAAEYVHVLEEKSARLKQLIEDLVEASKASSGNLSVTLEKVDLHELIMQACGEYEEKVKNAELDFRINVSEKKPIIYADGKYMWRIVENLISNVIKYSMSHSRVYIDLYNDGEYGLLTIKNISAFPLNIPSEQLAERFVRGDESRSTEGSGLGLSIAQSLTTLQGGQFGIEIDGDLFKVNVEMPLWIEAE